MKYRYIKYFLCLFLFAGTGCEKYFDDTMPTDWPTTGSIFSYPDWAVYYVNACYLTLPDGYSRTSSSFMAVVTDEAVPTNPSNSINNMANGAWSPTSLVETLNGEQIWGYQYGAIRRAFHLLENIDQTPDMDPIQLENVRGQAQLIQAMAYFELIKRWGGVPIIPRVMVVGEDLQYPRLGFKTCVKHIIKLCDEAYPKLPASVSDTDFGRMTQGAALGLKSRVLLYAASDLYNVGVTDSLVGYANASAADRTKRYTEAAQTAKQVIDNRVLFQYTLNAKYNEVFTKYNREYMMVKTQGNDRNVEQHNYPISYSGNGSTNPTQQMVDAYEVIKKDSKGVITGNEPFDWNNPAHASNPYLNRDPRFAMTIYYNGSLLKAKTVDTYPGGKDNIPTNTNSTKTGYYLKKFCEESVSLSPATGTGLRHWPIMRYAEILLNYAEAVNELVGPDAQFEGGMTARQAVNMIRQRAYGAVVADIFAMTKTYPYDIQLGLSKDQMRQKVLNERRVELAYEEHRMWDVRRWKILESSFNVMMKGVSIRQNADKSFTYSPVDYIERVYTDKMYFYPIPQSEINMNQNMRQNPKW